MVKRKKPPAWIRFWWYRPLFRDPTPYLNQAHVKTSGPNKKVVLVCLIAVITAIVVLLIKALRNFH